MILRDSIDPTLIPLDELDAVAGYGDGRFEWSSAGWARFPSSVTPLSIVVSAVDVGDILDVEKGDAAPADCPGWADRFQRPGRRHPTIYASRDTIGAVRAAMGPRPFDWWAATLDGTVDVPGAVAIQYRDFGGYDESLIIDPSWIGKGDPMSDDQLRAFVALCYASFLRRWPPDAERDFYVAQIKADPANGLFGFLLGFLDHAEADPAVIGALDATKPWQPVHQDENQAGQDAQLRAALKGAIDPLT